MKRSLPTYIYRKRSGLYFEKRVGTGKIVRKLDTQFPEGKPIPEALYAERQRLLNIQPTYRAGGHGRRS
ncbi:MAG: hypothetical protein ABJH45_02830 [Paracoccaceae bacterium]